MDPIKEEEVQEKSKFIISIESYLNTGCCSVCNYFRIGKNFSSTIKISLLFWMIETFQVLTYIYI